MAIDRLAVGNSLGCEAVLLHVELQQALEDVVPVDVPHELLGLLEDVVDLLAAGERDIDQANLQVAGLADGEDAVPSS